MDLFSAERLKALLGRPKGPCVSVYLPTHRGAAESQQDRIRLKNLLRQSEERLEAVRVRPSDAKGILGGAHALLEDDLFWRRQADGLALFAAPETFHYYRLPRRFAELVVVTDRFHLKPLLPLLTNDGRFYILALSQNEVRFLHGSRDSVGEVYLKDVPKSLAEALKYDVIEKQLQIHPRSAGGQGGRPAIFHGHGAGDETAKENILRYFQKIDRGLQEILREKRAPLVLAGVDFLLPLYREANTYPHLVQKGIPGNPERFNPGELHQRAWAVVQSVFLEAQEQAAARYRKLAGTGKTSSSIDEIIPASYHGRVDHLFVALGDQKWGLFDPAEGKVYVNPEPLPGDEDLLDLAAVQALTNGGTVYALESDKMPDSASLAAVYRY